MAKIGKFCSISSKVQVVFDTHPINRVSTFPGFYKSNYPRFPYSNNLFNELLLTKNGFSCEIGNDVWIGTNVIIKGGIVINDGAIIGMGSIVTHDVPPYSIVAGNPAKLIRMRFSDDIISKLLEIKWWDWTLAKIQENKDTFDNPSLFIMGNIK